MIDQYHWKPSLQGGSPLILYILWSVQTYDACIHHVVRLGHRLILTSLYHRWWHISSFKLTQNFLFQECKVIRVIQQSVDASSVRQRWCSIHAHWTSLPVPFPYCSTLYHYREWRCLREICYANGFWLVSCAQWGIKRTVKNFPMSVMLDNG